MPWMIVLNLVKKNKARNPKYYVQNSDLERWLESFAVEIGKMTPHQQLRVSRITTPTKICGGRKCLLIHTKLCPVILGIVLDLF